MLLWNLSQQLSHLCLANMFICKTSGMRYTERFQHVHKHVSQLRCLSFLLFIQLKKTGCTEKRHQKAKKNPKKHTNPSLGRLSAPFTVPREERKGGAKRRPHRAETSFPTRSAQPTMGNLLGRTAHISQLLKSRGTPVEKRWAQHQLLGSFTHSLTHDETRCPWKHPRPGETLR